MVLALKIDVATLVGARQGVPALIELLKKNEVGASFLFNLGRDETRALVHSVFHSGLGKKIARLLGSKTNCLGVFSPTYWTPSRDLGKHCSDVIHQVRAAGFDIGIHSYDPVAWHGANLENAERACSAINRSFKRYQEIIGEPPRVHSAGGWRMNHHAFRATQRLGLDYSSDTRGISPYVPLINAEIVACPQLPTTLPTLDEVIRSGVGNVDAVVDRLCHIDHKPQIYTARAELEGIALLALLEKLIIKWREEGFDIVSLNRYVDEIERKNLPRHGIALKKIGTHEMVVQGKEFLTDNGGTAEIFPTYKGQLAKIRDLS